MQNHLGMFPDSGTHDLAVPGLGRDVLTTFARKLGTMAGYLHRRSAQQMLTDIRRLFQSAPERSLMAAVLLGFLVGAVVHDRSSRGKTGG